MRLPHKLIAKVSFSTIDSFLWQTQWEDYHHIGLAQRMRNRIIVVFMIQQLRTINARHAISAMCINKQRPGKMVDISQTTCSRVFFLSGTFLNLHSMERLMKKLALGAQLKSFSIGLGNAFAPISRLSDKPLYDAMMTQFTYEWFIYASLGRCVLLPGE